jgi:tRNA threonylcarbamoyladenosine biosynthesis protein TsaB
MLEAKIISIETTSNLCGVALSRGEVLLGEYAAYDKNPHDKLLAEFVRRILEDHNLTIDDIDAVAVSAGPGSFTGLRIGASVAKGLCFGDEPKLISVPTLDALAFDVVGFAKEIGKSKIVATVPSHKNILYYREYNAKAHALGDIIVSTKEEVSELDFAETIVCGPAAGNFDKITSYELLNHLDTKKIARLANKSYSDNDFTKADEFKPLYIQDFTPRNLQKKLEI